MHGFLNSVHLADIQFREKPEFLQLFFHPGGLGASPGSTTSFKVELIEDGSDLYWQDGAHIAMCQTSNATPCTVDILASESSTCQNGTPNVCNDDEIGGGSGGPCQSCGDTDWPSAKTDKDKK
jgi:hypothetical protein